MRLLKLILLVVVMTTCKNQKTGLDPRKEFFFEVNLEQGIEAAKELKLSSISDSSKV